MSFLGNLFKKKERSDRVAPLPYDIQITQNAADKFDYIWKDLQNAFRSNYISASLYRSLQNAYMLRDYRGMVRLMRTHQRENPSTSDLYLPILSKLEKALLDYEVAQFSMTKKGYDTFAVDNAPKLTSRRYEWENTMDAVASSDKRERYEKSRERRGLQPLKRNAWSGGAGGKRRTRRRFKKRSSKVPKKKSRKSRSKH